jgi:uncharacterized protein YbaP (TraB family)
MSMALMSPLALAQAPPANTPQIPEVADVLPESASEAGIESVEVIGERPGPGLWRVSRGERSVYILGTLSPTPRKMVWRSRQVEAVLDDAAQVIPERPSVDLKAGPIRLIKLYRQWRKLRVNPGNAQLDSVLPAPLFARFEALRQKYAPRDDDLLELRPLLAATGLYQAAVESVGLKFNDKVVDQVRKEARQRKVPVLEIEQKLDDPQAVLADLANMNPATEQACLAATVARLEVELNSLRDRAAAWAVGDIARLRSQSAEEQQNACLGALNSAPRVAAITAEFDRRWFEAVVKALETQEVTLAITPIGRLLRKDGVLAQLQARGYTVTPPK